MFNSDKWIEIWHVLSKNKVRTFLTGLGVFTGMYILIVLIASGDGLQRGVLSQFNGLGSNSFVAWRGQTTMAYKGFNPGRTIQPTIDDKEALEAEVKGLDKVYPRCGGRWAGAKTVTRNGISEGFTLRGDIPGVYDLLPVYTSRGRFLNEDDVKECKKVAVIGTHVYQVLFDENESPIGQFIKINGAYFQVIGVLESESVGSVGEEDEKSVFIPISTYQKVYKTGKFVGSLFITADEGITSTAILEESLSALAKKHQVHPDDSLVFGHIDFGLQYTKLESLFAAIQILMWVVGLGTLFSGVVGVSNIMLIVVKERTQEFGVMRAIGASPKVVRNQVVLESIVLTAFFGVIGFLAGIYTTELKVLEMFFVKKDSGMIMFMNPTIDFNIALISLGVIIMLGTLAGLVPANRAIKIRPVEALQSA